MDAIDQDLGIGVDVGGQGVPRLSFSLAGHTTNVALSTEGAARLAGSLLTASFICSLGEDIPEGTPVPQGQIAVTSFFCETDSSTGLPVLGLTLMGGAKLAFVFTSDLAVACATALASEGVKAAPAKTTGLHIRANSTG